MFVLLPVPEAKREAVMRLLFGADGGDSAPGPVASSRSIEHGLYERWPDHAEMPDEDVRRAYRASHVGGGKRRILFEYLSKHPGQVLSYEELSSTFGWGRNSLPGVISAYIRAAASRFGGQRPFRIWQDASNAWFMSMDDPVATIIRDEASKVG